MSKKEHPKVSEKLWREFPLEKRVAELEFKLKKLENFVFQHHHRMDEVDDEGYETKNETGPAKVWVSYPNGDKEEPED